MEVLVNQMVQINEPTALDELIVNLTARGAHELLLLAQRVRREHRGDTAKLCLRLPGMEHPGEPMTEAQVVMEIEQAAAKGLL
jgi:hypothetical protein